MLPRLLDETGILRNLLAQILAMEEAATSRMSKQEERALTEMNAANTYVVTTTFYPDTSGRCDLSMDLFALTSRYN